MPRGKIVITIDEYRKSKNISKYSIIKNCGLSATQLNNYCSNKITRVDLPVIARICDFMHCDISDILRYEPREKSIEHEE